MIQRDEAGSPLGVLLWAEITFSDGSGPKVRLYQASSETEVRRFIESVFGIGPRSYRLKTLDWHSLPTDVESSVITIVSDPVAP